MSYKCSCATIHSPSVICRRFGKFGTSYDCACRLFVVLESSDDVSVTLEYPATAHARLFIVLESSDDVSLNIKHPTTVLARLFVVLENSDEVSVTLEHPTTAHADSS
jgi:hypothetical protein